MAPLPFSPNQILLVMLFGSSIGEERLSSRLNRTTQMIAMRWRGIFFFFFLQVRLGKDMSDERALLNRPSIIDVLAFLIE